MGVLDANARSSIFETRKETSVSQVPESRKNELYNIKYHHSKTEYSK